MTVSSIYQSFSVAAVSLNISTLSPEARATSEAPENAEPVPVAPRTPSRAERRAERRAEALFGALDADHDGAITAQEFTEGAVALLRRAGDRRRVHEHDGEGDGHGDGAHASRGLRRLERKLEKAFGRVDANDDGAIDQSELTSALADAGRRRGGNATPTTSAEPTAPHAPAAAGTSMTFSFTFVSVAVQRYTELQPPATATGETPATDETRAA